MAKTNLERLYEIVDQINAEVVGALKHPAHLAQWEKDEARAISATEHDAVTLAPELARYWLGQIRGAVTQVSVP